MELFHKREGRVKTLTVAMGRERLLGILTDLGRGNKVPMGS